MSDNTIKSLLREITKDRTVEIYSVLCSVDSVDTTERTIDATPLNGDAQIFNIRLQSEINSNMGLCIFPVIGSVVIVTFMNKLTGFVSTFSEIDKIFIDTTNEVIFDGVYNGGLVKVTELTNKINVLENDINTLKTLLSGWVPVPSDGGASLKTALGTYFSQTITPTIKTDIENDKIKH